MACRRARARLADTEERITLRGDGFTNVNLDAVEPLADDGGDEDGDEDGDAAVDEVAWKTAMGRLPRTF
jgi:hypothetical protein